MKPGLRIADYGALAFITLVWGLSWPFTIVGLRYADPFLLASLRCFVGAGALYLWRTRSKSKEHFDRRSLRIMFVVGLCWVGIPTALTMWGLLYISGGLGSILQSTIPFFVAIFAFLYLGENRLTPVKTVGLLVGFLGVIVLFSDDPISTENWLTFAGGFAMIVCSASIGFAQAVSRKHFKGRDQVEFNMYMQWFGGIVILPLAFLGGLPRLTFSPELIIALVFLGIFATAIPFTLYFELFQRVDIVILSMMAYVIPLVAVVAGIIWLGEQMTPTDIVGACLVLLGVVLATQYHAVKLKLFPRSSPSSPGPLL